MRGSKKRLKVLLTVIHRACQTIFCSFICKAGVSGGGTAKPEMHTNIVKIVHAAKAAATN